MTEPGLPPYDPDAVCPKCGHYKISTRHIRLREPFLEFALAMGIRLIATEHMRRECLRCQHAWAETPLDQADGAEPVVQVAPTAPNMIYAVGDCAECGHGYASHGNRGCASCPCKLSRTEVAAKRAVKLTNIGNPEGEGS